MGRGGKRHISFLSNWVKEERETSIYHDNWVKNMSVALATGLKMKQRHICCLGNWVEDETETYLLPWQLDNGRKVDMSVALVTRSKKQETCSYKF